MVQAAPVPVQVVRPRRESPERWGAALRRAIANGLEVFVVADTGERMVTSASKLDTLHRTDGYACSCEAAQAGDPVCQHRAAVRFCLGWLTVPDPAPPCPACHGSGRRPNHGHRWLVPCETCGGSGTVPDRRLTGLPSVVPVAAAA